MIRLNKTTRYALYAALEMARADAPAQVTAARVAERYSLPATVMAKVFQQLVRAGIAVGTRGLGGGYRLAAAPSRFTVLDVVEAFEPTRVQQGCRLDEGDDGACDDSLDCSLGRLFDEVDELARNTFASITLETLVKRPRPGMGPQMSGTAW
jgi:Rrf2 family iron-sulfur cluster assembly transcriptional regulator